MELYQEILSKEFQQFLTENFQENIEEIVKLKCYQALSEIKKILDDDTLDDPECFWKIEQIVCVFESLGSDGGSRHDFG